ncbi:hypothetical protein [Oceanibacterium hippocampi]|uniref:Uncharacterized protein n=1 Tax=Oceanibacterium hippocampi TaxID=745714 RepID=A0A1Y5TKE4_9PROT|nr:hypothetical protein [Oceanibacterium hippocampi]SLN62518.1 hypothetical protein OCH7691_02770 [Oceanibacterium hippocampi]
MVDRKDKHILRFNELRRDLDEVKEERGHWDQSDPYGETIEWLDAEIGRAMREIDETAEASWPDDDKEMEDRYTELRHALDRLRDGDTGATPAGHDGHAHHA